jgi:tRNA threonylcarbamoyladenosine biosynthesis protein TsaE
MVGAERFVARAETTSATDALAREVSALLKPGSGLLLMGDVGVGKTYFIQQIAAALGAKSPVTSPTFGLVNVYDADVAPLIHIDAYRLANLSEFRLLGLDEMLEEGIGLIEWGERVAKDFPWYHQVRISLDGEAREFELTGRFDPSDRPLSSWRPEAPAQS